MFCHKGSRILHLLVNLQALEPCFHLLHGKHNPWMCWKVEKVYVKPSKGICSRNSLCTLWWIRWKWFISQLSEVVRKDCTKNRQTEGSETLREDVYYKESSGDSLWGTGIPDGPTRTGVLPARWLFCREGCMFRAHNLSKNMADRGRGVSSCQVTLRRTKYAGGLYSGSRWAGLRRKVLATEFMTCWSGRFSKEVVLFD